MYCTLLYVLHALCELYALYDSATKIKRSNILTCSRVNKWDYSDVLPCKPAPRDIIVQRALDPTAPAEEKRCRGAPNVGYPPYIKVVVHCTIFLGHQRVG